MFSIETVILYLTMVTVVINGQAAPYSLPIVATMSAACNAPVACEAGFLAANAIDADAASCAAPTVGLGAMITIDLKATYAINSITIVVKQKVTVGAKDIVTTVAGVGAAANSMTVSVSPTAAGAGTACTSATPNAPFTTTGDATTGTASALYACANTYGQYIILAGAGTEATRAAVVCSLTVTQVDTTTTATTTITTTRAGGAVTNATVAKSARFVRFDWSIMIAMLLAVVKVTMNNGRHY